MTYASSFMEPTLSKDTEQSLNCVLLKHDFACFASESRNFI